MYPDQAKKSVGGLVGASTLNSVTSSKPMSEIESEFNKLGSASEYLSTRISMLENRLSPILTSPMPSNENEKETEPQTQIGKAIRGHKEQVNSFIYRIESIINRLSL